MGLKKIRKSRGLSQRELADAAVMKIDGHVQDMKFKEQFGLKIGERWDE